MNGRVPFYIHKHEPEALMTGVEYFKSINPLGYIEIAGTFLEEAIQANASDELLWWLTTDMGAIWSLEVARHHWKHGEELLFAECLDRYCRRSWTEWQIIMPPAIDKHIQDTFRLPVQGDER